MKRVGPSAWMLAVSVLVWLFALLCTIYGVWALVTGEVSSDPAVLKSIGVNPNWEELIYYLGVPLFGAFVVYFAFHIFFMGTGCILYDEEMVVFVLNRRERRSYRWRDLGPSGVAVHSLREIEPGGAVFLLDGWYFSFPDGRRLPIRAILPGYGEFVDLLAKKGLLALDVRRRF